MGRKSLARRRREGGATVTNADIALAVFAVAGLVGAVFYAYSSYKIAEKFGKWSSPYFAVYVVLLLAALSPAAQVHPITSPLAILMSVVSWILYSHVVLRQKIVRRVLPVRIAAIVIGLLALVIFPLLPQLALGFALLYRAGASAGWLAGLLASGKEGEKAPPPSAPRKE